MRTGDIVAALFPEIFFLLSFELRSKIPLSSPCKWLVETACYFFFPFHPCEFTMSYPRCAHVSEWVCVLCECLCMCVHVHLCTCVCGLCAKTNALKENVSFFQNAWFLLPTVIQVFIFNLIFTVLLAFIFHKYTHGKHTSEGTYIFTKVTGWNPTLSRKCDRWY